MRPIHIPQLLNAPNKTLTVEVAEHLPDLETLTPVKGEMVVTHQGTYLDVKGRAEAIMTLECDRCLQSYNTRVQVNTAELVWLEDPASVEVAEREVELEDLVESISPQGYFNPGEWLYQQMCLAVPQKQICSNECKGIEITSNPPEREVVDDRWAALTTLKQQLSE